MNNQGASKKDHGMSQEELDEHRQHFEDIIYDNLLKVLETRPKNPVSKFAKMILEDAGLNKDGDPIPDAQVPTRKDRKKVAKGDLEDEKPQKKKDKKKSADEDSAEEERKEIQKQQINQEIRAKKKAAKKAEEKGDDKPEEKSEEKPPAAGEDDNQKQEANDENAKAE